MASRVAAELGEEVGKGGIVAHQVRCMAGGGRLLSSPGCL